VGGLAIVVPGSSVARTRVRLVRDAERVARRLDGELVVFSGCSPDDGQSEAEHMRELWSGPDIQLLVENTATSTAENAMRTLPLLLERDVGEAVVVCTPAHLPRARWIFLRLYGAGGIEVRFAAARVVPTPGALLWELGAATVARRQVRAELERA
jgi:uncharacterized SAM-binding protein YcdF (DUF218 family)